MYGIYIVDDEKIIVDGLINTIPWLEYGFQVIGSNTDPEAAIFEITAMKPDVVFSDLKMPGCDGIELIGRVKENGINTEFVILSAFAEFDASRDFFLMGGIDYILKPLNYGKAGLVLEKVSRKLADKNNQTPSIQFAPSQSVNFDDLVAYVTVNFNKKHSLNDLSERFNMAATYICDLFAKHYDSTLKLFITNLRMKEAMRLILETDTPLKEISAYCGYPNYQHFCKVFKAHYNKIPSDYREGIE